MIREKIITNKHDAHISVQAINDVLNTKIILGKINTIDWITKELAHSIEPSHVEEVTRHVARREGLCDQLNMMWDGSKYSHGHQG